MQALHAGKELSSSRRGAAAPRAAAASAALLLALLGAASAAAGPGLLVGATDDAFAWDADAAARAARELGLGAARVSVSWSPGLEQLDGAAVARLDAATAATQGLRLVVTVLGKATAAPRTDAARDAYCSFVRDLLARYPAVRDVVVWNEANLGFYWQPQFLADGSSAAPADYEALLARCWDVLHAFRPDVNIVLTTSPSGNDNPSAASNVSHSPTAFIRKLASAYRASGRAAPIFDTAGHNPFGMGSAEPPSQQHLAPEHVGEGDYDRLVGALTEGFRGTAQPVPGRCEAAGQACVSIWYLEAGFQTAPGAAHAGAYVGRENDAQPVADAPAVAGAPTQTSQLAAAITLAYCQPYVGAFFNFLLRDEPDLARWQSGVLWADGSRKASFDALRRTVEDVRAGRVDCAARTPAAPARDPLVERLEWPPLRTLSAFNEIWEISIDARTDVRFRARIERVGPRVATPLTISGTLRGGRPSILRFPERRLAAGAYRVTIVVTRLRGAPVQVTHRSPRFVVR